MIEALVRARSESVPGSSTLPAALDRHHECGENEERGHARKDQPTDHADHERDQEDQHVAALVEQGAKAYQRRDAGQHHGAEAAARGRRHRGDRR